MNNTFVSGFMIDLSMKLTNGQRNRVLTQSQRSQVKHFLNCRRYSKRGLLPEQVGTIAVMSTIKRDTEEAILRHALTSVSEATEKPIGRPLVFDRVVEGELKEMTITGSVSLEGDVVVDSVKVAEAIVADAAPAVELKAFCVECESGSEGFSLARNENGAMTADRARDLEEPARKYARMNPGVKVRVIRSKGENLRAVLRFRYVSGKGIGTY